MSIAPIMAIDPGLAQIRPDAIGPGPIGMAPINGHSFGQMLLDGIADADRKMVDADRMVAAFALDDSVPVHQVTYALEQARLSFELMLQVRDRLLDGYRRVMDMQV